MTPTRPSDASNLLTVSASPSTGSRPADRTPSTKPFVSQPQASYSDALEREPDPWLKIEENLDCRVYCLEDICLQADTVFELFRQYADLACHDVLS